MAGRSRDKLEELRAQLEKVDARCANTPILTAELHDQKALDKLVRQADVIISTAGPFWNIGTPMVCKDGAESARRGGSTSVLHLTPFQLLPRDRSG